MKSSEIISIVIGGTFFSVPFLALNIPAIPSALIGLVAFGAGELIFHKPTVEQKIENTQKEVLENARKQVTQIYDLSKQLENIDTAESTRKIALTATKIIDTIDKKPEKFDSSRNFLNYYLPVTIKVLNRYNEIEDQKLISEDSKKFMKSVENMIPMINTAFEEQLSKIYQSDIIDTDADIKVFDSMLKSDGLIDDLDIKNLK